MKKLFIILIVLTCCSVAYPVWDVPQDKDFKFPVKLINSSDHVSGVTGKAFGDTTVQYSLNGANSWTSYTDDATTWIEVGNGHYWLKIGESEFTDPNVAGQVRVSVSGCDDAAWQIYTTYQDIGRVATTDDGGTINVSSGVVDSNLTNFNGSSSDQTVLNAIGFFDVSVQPAKNYGSDVATVLQQTPTSEENRHEGHILLDTTIATVVTPDTVITLTAGENTYDGFYVGHEAVIEDDSSSTRRVTAMVAGYTASTRTLTFASDPTPGAWTLDADDKIWIRANRKSLTWTDFFMEDLPGVPSITDSIKKGLNWLFCMSKQKTVTNSATKEIEVYKDNSTTKMAEADYDDDGTKFTRSKYGTPD